MGTTIDAATAKLIDELYVQTYIPVLSVFYEDHYDVSGGVLSGGVSPNLLMNNIRFDVSGTSFTGMTIQGVINKLIAAGYTQRYTNQNLYPMAPGPAPGPAPGSATLPRIPAIPTLSLAVQGATLTAGDTNTTLSSLIRECTKQLLLKTILAGGRIYADFRKRANYNTWESGLFETNPAQARDSSTNDVYTTIATYTTVNGLNSSTGYNNILTNRNNVLYPTAARIDLATGLPVAAASLTGVLDRYRWQVISSVNNARTLFTMLTEPTSNTNIVYRSNPSATVSGMARQTNPLIFTLPVTISGLMSVTAGGIIVSDGGREIQCRGVVVSTSTGTIIPSVATLLSSSGASVTLSPTSSAARDLAPSAAGAPATCRKSTQGPFSVTVPNLVADTTYYIRAYVITGDVAYYGREDSFKIPPPFIVNAAFESKIVTQTLSGTSSSTQSGTGTDTIYTCISVFLSPCTARGTAQIGYTFNISNNNNYHITKITLSSQVEEAYRIGITVNSATKSIELSSPTITQILRVRFNNTSTANRIQNIKVTPQLRIEYKTTSASPNILVYTYNLQPYTISETLEMSRSSTSLTATTLTLQAP